MTPNEVRTSCCDRNGGESVLRIAKDPAERREDILSAAQELFSKEGYQNTSVESIVQRAGIAKGSFYNYFKSKDEVMDAVLQRMAEDILANVKEVLLDRKHTPKQRIHKYLDFSFGLAVQRDKSLTAIITSDEMINLKEMYENVLNRSVKLIIPTFQQLLEEGRERGEFSILDAEFTAVVVMGAFRQIHISFYETLGIDFDLAKKYIMDFLSRVLQTDF
jgi:AcrR family transcriptional regulator